MVLIDKGYYDYDYQAYESEEEKRNARLRTIEQTEKSDEEVRNALARFGWGKKRKDNAEELQQKVINDLKERKG